MPLTSCAQGFLLKATVRNEDIAECKQCHRQFSSNDALRQHSSARHTVKSSKHHLANPKRIRTGVTKLVFIVTIVIAVFLIGNLLLASSNRNNSSAWIGRQASDFTLPAVDGSMFTLKDHAGRSNVLLFFNEGLMCSPCLRQMQDLLRCSQSL